MFIASSLLDMGLRLDPPGAARGLRNIRFVGLTVFWGFVVSPALAFAITWLTTNRAALRDGITADGHDAMCAIRANGRGAGEG